MTVWSPVTRARSPPDRAQTEVLGVVLLIGMVSVAALGLMLVASGAVAESEAQAEQERIEQSFVQLGHSMATASATGDMPESVEFDVGDSGAITKTDAGTFTIQGGNVNESITVGAVEYEHEDGSVIAYQAGGVWAERGNQTRMLSAPPISYDPVDETLTLPVTNMSEQRDLSSGPVKVSTASTDPLRQASLVQNDSVTLTIESPYYRGWEKYFRTESGNGVIRNVDHRNQTVRVKFGPLELEDALSRGATYSETPGGGHPQKIKDEGETGNMRVMDETIDEMVADANDDSMTINDSPNGTINSDTTFTSGTYLLDSIDGGSHEFDLTGGNITLIVDGNIKSDGNGDFMKVTEYSDNHQLKIYTTGHLDIQNGGNICVKDCGSGGDSSRLQFYGTSETTVNINTGNPEFEGIIYVASDKDSWEYSDRKSNGDGNNCPTDKYQVAFQGSADFTGSMIAGTICAQSNGYKFSYDSSLDGENIDPYPDGYAPPPRITYLNVAVHQMDVTNE